MQRSLENRQCHDNICADKLGAFSSTIVESCYYKFGLDNAIQS